MATVERLIFELSKLGVTLWEEGGDLRFRGPAGATNHPAFAALRGLKAEVVSFLAARKASRFLPPVCPVARGPKVPLSQSQQIIWDLNSKKAPGEQQGVMELVVPPPLDIDRCGRALNAIIARHEILRTTFREERDELVQVVLPSRPIELEAIDLTFCSPQAARILIEEKYVPAFHQILIDVEAGPLLGARLCSLSDGSGVLLLVFHRLIVDFHSQHILAAEFEAYCRAVADDNVSEPAALHLQYADFALWEQAHITRRRADQPSTWSCRLAGIRPIDLAVQHGKVPPFAAGVHGIVFPQSAALSVGALSSREGVSSGVVLIAAVGALMSAWTGQSRTAFGMLVAGRPPGTERLVGAFARIKPLIMEADVAKPFVELLRETNEAHQNAANPIEPASIDDLEDFNLRRVLLSITQMAQEPKTERRPVRALAQHVFVSLYLSPTSIGGRMDYAREVMDEEKIRWFAHRLPLLLERAASDPETALGELMGPRILPNAAV